MKTKNIKLFSLVMMMFLFVFSFVGVLAKEEKKRLVDNAGLLDTNECAALSMELNDISEQYGCDVVIVTESDIGNKSSQEYADDYFDYNGYGIGDDRSGILLLINMSGRDWHISTSGRCIKMFTDSGLQSMANKFLPALKKGEYKKAFETFIERCNMNMAQSEVSEKAQKDVTAPQGEKIRLVDNAKLLDSSEYKNLLSKLDELSERQGCDVVIITEDSTGDKSSKEYADDYFYYNGYGIGEDSSGILLLINMNNRDWYIARNGYCMRAFTDAGLDFIANKFLPDLKDNDYEDAFEIFIDQCDKFITKWKTDGTAYDKNNLPKEPLSKFWIIGSIIIGVVASWITMSCLKNQLKTVCKKLQANDYIRKNSLHIKNSRDIFLYSNITRRARPKSNSGSSTHRGSSGRIHGGRGGKF